MKFFLFLFLFIKIAFATCTLSVPTVNLGAYNSNSGNSAIENMTSTSCASMSYASYDQAQTVSNYSTTLSNGTSSITATATNTLWSLMGSNYYYYTVCSNASGTPPVFGNVGVSVFCTTVSVPSGKTLTSGTYSGNLPVNFWGDSAWFVYSMPITMTVGSSCSVSSSGISFGNITGGLQTTVTGTISSTCTNGSTYTLVADGGISANISARTMKNGANILNYQLYKDSGYTTVFGNGTIGASISLTGTGTAQSSTVYGKVLSGQYPTPGSYSDTINITMTY